MNPFDPAAGYKLDVDESWHHEKRGQRQNLEIIPCPVGHVYIQNVSRSVLAYTGQGMKLRNKLLSVPGVKSHQTGDEEFAVTFPVASFKAVAKIVRPKKRKKLSPEHLAALRKGASNSLVEGLNSDLGATNAPQVGERAGAR
jgi:hypothetical protein